MNRSFLEHRLSKQRESSMQRSEVRENSAHGGRAGRSRRGSRIVQETKWLMGQTVSAHRVMRAVMG